MDDNEQRHEKRQLYRVILKVMAWAAILFLCLLWLRGCFSWGSITV